MNYAPSNCALPRRRRRARVTAMATVRFGVLADVQYADKADKEVESGVRPYREALGKLERAVDALAAAHEDAEGPPLSFCMNLGDSIDGHGEGETDWFARSVRDLKRVAACFGRLRSSGVPLHHVVGNHCICRGSVSRAAFAREMECATDWGAWGGRSYGSFCPTPSLRCVVLDSMDLALSGWWDDQGNGDEDECRERRAESESFLAARPLESEPQLKRYNGGLGRGQLRWLEGELREAERAGQAVVVFMHHPVTVGEADSTGPREHMPCWNHEEVRALLLASPAFGALLAGHHHRGGYQRVDGRHFVTVESILEAPAGTTAYLVATWDPAAGTLTLDAQGSAASSHVLPIALPATSR